MYFKKKVSIGTYSIDRLIGDDVSCNAIGCWLIYLVVNMHVFLKLIHIEEKQMGIT